MKIPTTWTFKDKEIAGGFDTHVREQLPWYELATQMVACIAKNYICDHGIVYDIGASTGNIGRSLNAVIEQRNARLIALEQSREMSVLYKGGGELIIGDACDFKYERFSVAISFLSLMFIDIEGRIKLIKTLKDNVRTGGAIIIVEKCNPPNGYIGTVLRRLTMEWKLANGATPDDVISKDISLSGVQRPLSNEIGSEFVEFFRMGEFVGWIMEGKQ